MTSRKVVDTEPSDESLLAGMAAGDEATAVAFVRRFQSQVFGLAYAMLGDRGMAEDVAQEALVRAWRHAQVFDARRGSVVAWLLTITRNLAIDSLRVRRGIPTGEDRITHALGPDPAAESALAAGSVRGELSRILARLPCEQRRALLLSAFYGYTAAEVAASEQIPLGTAKTRIRAALQKTRRSYASAQEALP